VICPRCIARDHLACLSADCTCGHDGSPVRALTDAERQQVRDGKLTARVLPRGADDEA